MNIKIIFIKLSVAALMLLFVTQLSFAQQQTTTSNVETVIFKLQKSDYMNNDITLQKSLSQIKGVSFNKFCNAYNKTFVILQVNRTLQPNDDNITNAISAVNIGYKKIESSNVQNILTSCN
jgi:hypothetical protein